MMMTANAVNCGRTEVWFTGQTVSWEVGGVESFLQHKLLPVFKLKSPSFEFPSTSRKWHLELVQTKPDFVKCILIPEDANIDEATVSERTSTAALSERRSNYLTSVSSATAGVGAVINEIFFVTRDKSRDSFSVIKERYEETNGWREWAGKFVEKRRKAGLTEYIFGVDFQAYENAFPWMYILEHRDRYIQHDTLKLEVELIFTGSTQNGINNLESSSQSERALLEQQTVKNNDALIQNLSGYYNTARHSDLTLMCGCRAFPVHKVIVEARAPFLAADLFSRPPVNQNNDTSPQYTEDPPPGEELLPVVPRSPIIKIEDIKCHILDIILRFVYTGKLPENICPGGLSQVSREARRFCFHDLTFSCFLKALDSHRNGSIGEGRDQLEEVMKEIYLNDEAIFKDRSMSIQELRRFYPDQFNVLNTLK